MPFMDYFLMKIKFNVEFHTSFGIQHDKTLVIRGYKQDISMLITSNPVEFYQEDLAKLINFLQEELDHQVECAKQDSNL